MTAAPDRQLAVSVAVAVAATVLFAALGLAVVLRGGTPLAVDESLHRYALDARTNALTAGARVITSTGSGLIAYAIAGAAGYVGGRQHPWSSAAGYLLALLSGQGVRLLLVMLIARPRPPVPDWAAPASGAAFPSGHATTAALVAALVCWTALRLLSGVWRWVVMAAALSWALAVGVTRVYLGVHWPTDVVGGWLLAAALTSVPFAVGADMRRRARAKQS